MVRLGLVRERLLIYLIKTRAINSLNSGQSFRV